MALLQGLSVLVQRLVGQRTFCLEPHALHLVQVIHCRRAFLKYTNFQTYFVPPEDKLRKMICAGAKLKLSS